MIDHVFTNPLLWNFTILKERILNSMNKNFVSDSYGCCDRLYWGWKFKDFPDSSFLYALYPLRLLLDEKDEYECQFYRAMLLRCANRLSNFRVDQSFPRERSAGPTLYVIHGVLSSLQISPSFLKNREKEFVLESVYNALKSCIREPEYYGHVANHKSLFAHTYILAYFQFGDKKFWDKSKSELKEIKNKLSTIMDKSHDSVIFFKLRSENAMNKEILGQEINPTDRII